MRIKIKKTIQTLRKKAFERDNFECQKCKIQDKTGKILEAHHIILLCFEGENNLKNIITLCKNCHHFAPNKKQEFNKYLKEENSGTLSTLVKVWIKTSKKIYKKNKT